MNVQRIIIILLLIWVMIRTISFGRWNWNNGSRLGAVMAVIIAIISFVLPVAYMIVFA